MGQAVATRAAGTPDLVITGAVILDHWGVVKADVGVRDGRIAAIGKAGQPRHHGRRPPRPGDRPVDRGHGGQRADPHRRRHRLPRAPDLAPQLPEALGAGITTLIGGGTGPAEGTKATTVTPGAWHLAPDARGDRRLAGQHRAARQGQHRVRRGAVGAAAGRGGRVQAARGLGHHAGRHRRLPRGVAGGGRADRDPHRHAERGGVRRGHARGDRRAADPRLPHRGRGRRARARTSSTWPPSPTCCRRRPTRPCRTRSTPSTSTSTCSWSATT